MTSKSFRATAGLDAAGEKVINVGKASRTVGSDAVNVDFFNEFNSVQQYDPTRGYSAFMAIIYARRLWYARAEITSPAGVFDETKWFATRNDPKWLYNNVTSADGLPVDPGTYLQADGRFAELTYILPDSPTEGDIVTIRDGGGQAGVNSIQVKSNTRQIRLRETQAITYRLTHPYMTATFIFNGNLWRVSEIYEDRDTYTVSATGAGSFQLQAGMTTFRNSATGKITLQLPKYANDGDSISTYDLDKMASVNAVTLQVYPGSGHSITYDGSNSSNSVVSQRSGYGIFMFDAANSRWVVYDGDTRVRLRRVSDDLAMLPNDYVFVTGQDGVGAVRDVALTLPADVADGDRVYVSMYMLAKNQNCSVKVKDGSGEKIRTNKNMMQFPQRKDYPVDGWFSVSSLTFNANTDYLPYMELSYLKASKEWVVASYRPMIERVDATNRGRTGVIALATQEEVNKNREDIPNDETAVTPSTLANKTATETRRGLARLATTAEVNQDSTATYADDIAVTPKKLNERTSTETRRGLLEIATQTETNIGTDDTTAVTPKKLNDRNASESLTGIAKLVKTGSTTAEGATRGDAGVNVYDFGNNTDILTPKSLNEKTATEKSKGLVVLATENEVITGAAAGSNDMPIVVTPVQLQKKTSTENRIGLIEIATQPETDAGTDDLRAVTPKKLNDRKATEALTGIIALATTDELAAGTVANKAVVPVKLKQFFDDVGHISVSTLDGMTQTGTIWGTVNLGIKVSTETQRGTSRIATQGEVNTGANDEAFVTAKKLQAKKATDTAEGIIRCATNQEAADGIANNIAITPSTMNYLNGNDPSWGATTQRRGAAFITTKSNTFIGDSTVGSTQAVDEYLEDFYAVSPRGLNFALANFLPKNAVAQDSLKLGGVIADSWIRRDIAQTVTGAMTFSAPLTTVSGVLTVAGTGESKIPNLRVNAQKGSNLYPVNIGTDGANGANGLQIFAASGAMKNNWSLLAGGTGVASTALGSLEFALVTGNVYASIFTAAGDNRVLRDVSVGRNLAVAGSVSLNAIDALSVDANGFTVGAATRDIVFKTKAGWDGLKVSNDNGSSTAIILNEQNYKKFVNNTHVQKTGDTMYGALAVEQNNTSVKITAADNRGYVQAGNLSSASTPATQAMWLTGLNGIDLTEFNIKVAQKDYEKVTINGNLIYHAGRKPTPDEIGAVARVGSTVDQLTVTQSIRVGNVLITANPDTKTCEFTWVE